MHNWREVAQQRLVALRLTTRLRETEATWHDEQHVRGGLERAQVRPFHPIRRPPSRSGDEIAARETDELGDPVAGHVGWIEPLQREDARSPPIGDSIADPVDARAQG